MAITNVCHLRGVEAPCSTKISVDGPRVLFSVTQAGWMVTGRVMGECCPFFLQSKSVTQRHILLGASLATIK